MVRGTFSPAGACRRSRLNSNGSPHENTVHNLAHRPVRHCFRRVIIASRICYQAARNQAGQAALEDLLFYRERIFGKRVCHALTLKHLSTSLALTQAMDMWGISSNCAIACTLSAAANIPKCTDASPGVGSGCAARSERRVWRPASGHFG